MNDPARFRDRKRASEIGGAIADEVRRRREERWSIIKTQAAVLDLADRVEQLERKPGRRRVKVADARQLHLRLVGGDVA